MYSIVLYLYFQFFIMDQCALIYSVACDTIPISAPALSLGRLSHTLFLTLLRLAVARWFRRFVSSVAVLLFDYDENNEVAIMIINLQLIMIFSGYASV